MTHSLAGRVALVTGSGNGIGRAIACRLAAEGAIVGINDLRPEFTRATIDLITAAGGQAVDLPMDAAVRDNVHAAVRTLSQRHGRFDIMVNNAAWVRYEAIATITEKTMDRMVNIGFAGVAWGIQAAAEAIEASNNATGGSIINIASAAAFLGLPNAMLYCGIKAGVVGLTRSAATDLGPKQIRVNAIAPGSTRTEAVTAKLSPETIQARQARIPLQRLGEPDDVAEACLFLAGDASRFISGSVISVDGGSTFAYS